jgi:hypothetical protein
MPDQRGLMLESPRSRSGVHPFHRTDPASDTMWPEVTWAPIRIDGACTPVVSRLNFRWPRPSSRHSDKSGLGMELHGTRSFPVPAVRMTSGWAFWTESALSHMIWAREVLRSSASCAGNRVDSSQMQRALAQWTEITGGEIPTVLEYTPFPNCCFAYNNCFVIYLPRGKLFQ